MTSDGVAYDPTTSASRRRSTRTPILASSPVAEARAVDDEHDAEIEPDAGRAAEEAVRVGVVERLDANDVRAGRQTADREAALIVEREAADHRSIRRIERDDVRAENRLAVFRHAARNASERRVHVGCRIDIGDAGDVVGFERTPFGAAGG